MSAQTRSLVSVGAMDSYSEGKSQTVSVLHSRGASHDSGADWYVPSAHSSSAVQTRSLVAVGGVLSYCDEQTHCVSAAHCRSLVLVPACVSYSSAPHSVHAAQLCWFENGWKVASAQASHMRSADAVGSATTREPGPQVLCGVQTRLSSAVQGLASYSSALHAVQATQRAVSASAKKPAGQAATQAPPAVRYVLGGQAVQALASPGALHSAQLPLQAPQTLSPSAAVPAPHSLTHWPAGARPTRCSTSCPLQEVQSLVPGPAHVAQLGWHASQVGLLRPPHTPLRKVPGLQASACRHAVHTGLGPSSVHSPTR